MKIFGRYLQWILVDDDEVGSKPFLEVPSPRILEGGRSRLMSHESQCVFHPDGLSRVEGVSAGSRPINGGLDANKRVELRTGKVAVELNRDTEADRVGDRHYPGQYVIREDSPPGITDRLNEAWLSGQNQAQIPDPL